MSPLLHREWFVTFFFPLKLFVWLFLHMVRRRQTVLSELESDVPSEEDKTGHSHLECCRILQNMLPSETESIRACSYQSLHYNFLSELWLYVDHSSNHLLCLQKFPLFLLSTIMLFIVLRTWCIRTKNLTLKS